MCPLRMLRQHAGQWTCRSWGVILDRRDPARSFPHFYVVTIAQRPRFGGCSRIVRTFMFMHGDKLAGRIDYAESIKAHAALPAWMRERGHRFRWCPGCLSSAGGLLATGCVSIL